MKKVMTLCIIIIYIGMGKVAVYVMRVVMHEKKV